eukprot:jgi/Botrbrau1/10468/Bobra.0133s0074.1
MHKVIGRYGDTAQQQIHYSKRCVSTATPFPIIGYDYVLSKASYAGILLHYFLS